jgi:hypothetical protein
MAYQQSNALEIAFKHFQSQLPPSTLRDLMGYQSFTTMSNVQEVLVHAFTQRQRSRVRRPLEALMAHMQKPLIVLDVFQQSTQTAGLVWGAMRVLIQVKLYAGLLDFLRQRLSLMSQSNLKRGLSRLSGVAQVQFQDSMPEIRKVSKSVMKEADYRHQVELRETNSRLKDMEKDQQRMPAAMEDQRRILASLQEERKIITVIQDQQKTLPVVQQLQMRFAAFTPATTSAVKVEPDVDGRIAAKEGDARPLE